jgi:Dyp-type peroxidase family
MANEFLTQKGLSYDGPEFTAIAKDLQGNILKSHGRRHTSHIFFRFNPGKQADARTFIKKFEPAVTSAQQQKNDTEATKADQKQRIFCGFYLTNAAYSYLGVAAAKVPTDNKFGAGMQASAAALADDPTTWEVGFQGVIHGMILLAFGSGSQRSSFLNTETRRIVRLLQRQGLATVLTVEQGDGIKNDNGDDIEHFGYVDGISQPRFFREEIGPDGMNNWNPVDSWDLVLVPDPGGRVNKSFGSYFVFRKLEQKVKEFKKAEERLADALGFTGNKRELAGALVVGRFENGMPVTLSDKDDEINGLPVSNNFVGSINDFNYGGDSAGMKCPFHAHVRKTNPRGESAALLPPQFGVTPESEKRHIMARRGIIYGKRDVHPNKQENLDLLPNGGVGLLFMSFQGNLANQFEFTQQSWANEDRFVKGFNPGEPATGKDPVIGQGSFASHVHRYAANYGTGPLSKLANGVDIDPNSPNVDFGGFVNMKGGEYFFAPSKSFLKSF